MMNKKQMKDKIISWIKVYFKIYLYTIPISIIFNMGIVLISGMIDGLMTDINIFEILIYSVLAPFYFFLKFGILILIFVGIVYLCVTIKRKGLLIKTKDYERELPEYFPPAVASLLLDLSVEDNTDYTATIAYLISKKYIKLSENGESIEVLIDNPVFKFVHEEYVYKCVTKQQVFNRQEFKNLVVEDAKKMNLIEEGKKIHFIRNILITWGLAYGCTYLYENVSEGIFTEILTILAIIFNLSTFIVIGYSVYMYTRYQKNKIYRTKKGRKVALKWTQIKNYLRDYTLIKDKTLNDIVIYEDYIPYAIALNEAQTIEEYIENNKQYRELIYEKNIK